MARSQGNQSVVEVMSKTCAHISSLSNRDSVILRAENQG